VPEIDNRVEIIVGARDMTKADISDLRARLDELGRKVATARVNVDDKAAQAKLMLRADDLQVPFPVCDDPRELAGGT
jgi:hypothetical protein